MYIRSRSSLQRKPFQGDFKKRDLPVNNLPGIWNDPYCVAADNDVDDVDVDPGESHLPFSQSSLKILF